MCGIHARSVGYVWSWWRGVWLWCGLGMTGVSCGGVNVWVWRDRAIVLLVRWLWIRRGLGS